MSGLGINQGSAEYFSGLGSQPPKKGIFLGWMGYFLGLGPCTVFCGFGTVFFRVVCFSGLGGAVVRHEGAQGRAAKQRR